MSFQTRFVVLTHWWSMRSGGSGLKFHEFESREEAEAWATKRHAEEQDVKGIVEMSVPS